MKKILLVEDDALLNKTLTYNLISEGYDTVSALNAGTAAQLQLFFSSKVFRYSNICLLSCTMPFSVHI